MDHNHIDDDDTHQHPPRSRAPSSLWCGSAQGILLAALGCGLAVIYQAFVLGPHDERQIQRAFGGWARDQYEAWVLGEGSAAIDMQCDLLRLRASDVSAEAFERVYRGRRPLVLMGRGPGQGWTAAARRRGPWFMGEADGDAVWTLEGLRAVLEENGGEGQRLRVAEDGRELVRRGWWWDEDDDGAVESCSAEADTAAGVRRMALDAYLAMGASSSSQGDYYDEEEEEMEEQEEEGYLLDAAALRTHAGLRTSALGATLVAPPAPLALAFADDSTTTTAFLAVGRSRGGLPWHTLDAEAWIGSVAGGFTQYLLLPPGRGLRNVTMGRLGAGQTHPLLSPWEFVMRALPFLDHHGPEGPSSPSTTTTSSRADGDDAAAIQEDKVEEWEGDTPPLSCLLRPGDAVYLPGGGWKAMRLHIGDALLVGASRGPGAGGEAQQQQHRRRLEESLAVLRRSPSDVEALLAAGLAGAHLATTTPTTTTDDQEQQQALALSHLRRAVALRPCDDGPRLALAAALSRFGDGVGAAAVLRATERVFQLEGEGEGDACPLPDWMGDGRRRRLLAGAQLRVARAWVRMGDKGEARRLLKETVLHLDGDYGPARELLAALG